jgi:hypothetical protein
MEAAEAEVARLREALQLRESMGRTQEQIERDRRVLEGANPEGRFVLPHGQAMTPFEAVLQRLQEQGADPNVLAEVRRSADQMSRLTAQQLLAHAGTTVVTPANRVSGGEAEGSRGSVRGSARLAEPSKFWGGVPGTGEMPDVMVWLEEVEDYLLVSGTSRDLWEVYGKAWLQGSAAVLYKGARNAAMREGKPVDWGFFRITLEKLFCDPSQARDALMHLLSLLWAPPSDGNWTLDLFWSKFQIALAEVNKFVTLDVHTLLAAVASVALPEAVRQLVPYGLDGKPWQSLQALRTAMEEQAAAIRTAVQQHLASAAPGQQRGNKRAWGTGSAVMGNAGAGGAGSSGADTSAGGEARGAKRGPGAPITCFRCHEAGHRSSECWAPAGFDKKPEQEQAQLRQQMAAQIEQWRAARQSASAAPAGGPATPAPAAGRGQQHGGGGGRSGGGRFKWGSGRGRGGRGGRGGGRFGGAGGGNQ